MRRIFLPFLWVLMIFPMACSDPHSNMGPAGSFAAVYKLALEGKYAETQEYFTSDMLKFLETNPDWSLQKVWEGRLENGKVLSVIVTEKWSDEKTARIKFMITNTEGTPGEEGEESMVYEKGTWKFDKIGRVR